MRLIVNPSAVPNPRSLEELREWFVNRTGRFDAVVTQSREEAIKLARQALREGVKRLVAVGGDGTVNAVANGFFEEDGRPVAPEAELAVAPLGTGCDFFRAFGAGRDWRDLALFSPARAIDIGRVEYLGTPRLSHFVNAASVGLSAEVVRRQRSLPRWLPALASYSIPSLTGLVSYRPLPFVITVDGRVS